MGKIKNSFKSINRFGMWLDRLIFFRFSENYTPAEYPVLLPFCFGILWGIVLVIFMFMDNAFVFNNGFMYAAIVASTSLNVMFHTFQMEKLPSVKAKLGYLVFITLLSVLVTTLIVVLIGWAVVILVVCFVLLAIGTGALSRNPPPKLPEEYNVELSNGDKVKHYYGDTWVNKSGEKYKALDNESKDFIKL